MGEIGRYGDLFIGIQNKKTYDMTISFYNKNNIIFETICIKSGEIGILKTPINLIKMRSKQIYYKIQNKTTTFFDFYSRTYNTEFIYGYVVKSLRMQMLQ